MSEDVRRWFEPRIYHHLENLIRAKDIKALVSSTPHPNPTLVFDHSSREIGLNKQLPLKKQNTEGPRLTRILGLGKNRVT